jgi:prepilin-type N-terminal cleavage/methylation domain-containing protein
VGTKLIPAAPARAGFSLIELLVVIAVLSVLTVGAVLATGRGGPETSPDMARFQAGFTLMQALAVQGRGARGLVIVSEGMQTAQAGAEGWVISDGVQPWRGRVVYAARGGQFDPGAPDIRFLSNGRSTAFSISFATGGRCDTDGWSGLTCAAQ